MSKEANSTERALKLALEALENWVEYFPQNVDDIDKKAITSLREALASEAKKPDFWEGYVPEPVKPAQPVALKWQQAPVKTQWGDDMVVASVAIDNDHTLSLYCERDQTSKVDAMFAQRQWVGLTDDEMWELWNAQGSDEMNQQEAIIFARAIEAAHGIKENT